jgi:hypothetical protein
MMSRHISQGQWTVRACAIDECAGTLSGAYGRSYSPWQLRRRPGLTGRQMGAAIAFHFPGEAPMGNSVQVYGTDWCGWTRGVREFLMNSRIPYDYYNVDWIRAPTIS